MIDLPDPDRLLANATTFLVQGQDFYEASILLLSKIDIGFSVNNNFIDAAGLDICIVADRAVYDIVTDGNNPHTKHTWPRHPRHILALNVGRCDLLS